MNGYNFTERVRNVFAMARYEARRRGHEYVGTEHLLLALVRESEGIASAVLANLNVDLASLKHTIDRTVPMGSAISDDADLPYTRRCKRAIELSMAEARDLNHNYVGTEHLLMGLLREETGIAAQVLVHSGLTVEKARVEVRRLLGLDALAEPLVTALNGPLSDRPVVAVNIEVRFADGEITRREFSGIDGAIEFLRRQQ